MQLMTWALARLGSRFSLLFEPYRRRVMHSALGRMLDEPLDLMVGLVEPDGAERVLPLSQRGELLFNCEQFQRINSITFRGYSARYGLRFEFNVHSVFYPQDEELCLMPAFYLEMRVNPAPKVRWTKPVGPTPDKVRLFIRLQRQATTILARAEPDGQARIDLAYRNRLEPVLDRVAAAEAPAPDAGPMVDVQERLVSLNPGAAPDADGQGLSLELPVTEEGSGTKWRLVWGAHCADRVLEMAAGDQVLPARFRYTRYWANIDQVMKSAVAERDDRLAHSRRFEKVVGQVPLDATQLHLFNQSFQAYLGNTWWCDVEGGREWFSVWEGSCFFHSTVDVEYNVCLLYLALWPGLLARQLDQWPAFAKPHGPSEGCILSHDMGRAWKVGQQAYPHDMPVEENANYLLMLQAYAHHTGDLAPARQHADFVQKLAQYLLWTDRDASGFPSEGTANTIDDASPATQFSRKQTYLAVKRVMALQAAADLLERIGRREAARLCAARVESDPAKIEAEAWLSDHFAVCVDRSGAGVVDAWTGQPLTDDMLEGWDAYSIYTANGLLLPLMYGQPCPFDRARQATDLTNAAREALGRYGCGHTSAEVDNVWVSQNLWRDHVARYLFARFHPVSDLYWDLQTVSNTHEQSFGFIDTYINNQLCFYPRGITSIGWFTAQPRLIVDRLAPGGARISVEPDTQIRQRWPLLPLADWKAQKIPVCVVDAQGRVAIESEIDPIIVRTPGAPTPGGVIG